MKLVDQNNEAYKSNRQNLDGVYSILMVFTQFKLIANNKAMNILEGNRIRLVYLVFCIANKQAVKVLKGRKFSLAYLVACIVSE